MLSEVFDWEGRSAIVLDNFKLHISPANVMRGLHLKDLKIIYTL